MIFGMLRIGTIYVVAFPGMIVTVKYCLPLAINKCLCEKLETRKMNLERTRRTHREKVNFFILKNEKMKSEVYNVQALRLCTKNRATDFPTNTEPITL